MALGIWIGILCRHIISTPVHTGKLICCFQWISAMCDAELHEIPNVKRFQLYSAPLQRSWLDITLTLLNSFMQLLSLCKIVNMQKIIINKKEPVLGLNLVIFSCMFVNEF